MAAVELRSVTKRFGETIAVDDLDLTVADGEIYGFLGPNGAGKSTTIDLMLDYVRPTSGTVTVLGCDPRAQSVDIRRRTGVLPEGVELYDRLTGREHLEFTVESKGADDDVDELAARVDIIDVLDRPVGGYSKGTVQRLALASALVGNPELLILDEPTTGLDPNGARQLRSIVREENERGATIFFSSHLLDQVEAICDRVGILRSGRLVVQNSIETLRETLGSGERFSVVLDTVPSEAEQVLLDVDGVSTVSIEATSVEVTCRPRAKPIVLNRLQELGATVEDFSIEEVTLDDVFAAYTTEGEA